MVKKPEYTGQPETAGAMWLPNDNATKSSGLHPLHDSWSDSSVFWLLAWSLQCTVIISSSGTHGGKVDEGHSGNTSTYFQTRNISPYFIPLCQTSKGQLPTKHELTTGQR